MAFTLLKALPSVRWLFDSDDVTPADKSTPPPKLPTPAPDEAAAVRRAADGNSSLPDLAGSGGDVLRVCRSVESRQVGTYVLR